MDLLKALAMPFHLGSLLFVATTSLLLTLILSVGGVSIIMAIPAICLIMIWLTRFTFTLIDDATNGVQEAAAASLEMLSPFGDARCWVHPALTAFIAIALFLQPEIPRLPVLAACALLLPASIGAIALTGNALDALNPFALVRVIRGLAHYYVLAVLWVTLCVAAGVLVVRSGLWLLVIIATLQLLLLLACAFIGGAVYARRVDLGFVPLVSPERVEQRKEDQRMAQRQHMIDGLYSDLRSRESARAVASARLWIEQAGPQQVPGDVKAILDAGAHWSEPRGVALLMRGLVPQLLSMRQPGLAFAAVEAGLTAVPAFTPEQEGDAVAMIRYALQSGRKRLAATLLANFMGSSANASTPGPELLELRARLHNQPSEA
ncbi:MAG: hypothetical protein ABIQ86_13840 [Steroidobacteraceae bacterium]